LTLPYWFDYVFFYFSWIIENKDRLRYGLTAVLVLLGLMLRAKSDLNNSKLLQDLQKEFKDRNELIDALVRFAKMLEIMDSQELCRRILIVSELELDMRIEVKKLNKIINVGDIEESGDIILSKKQQKDLQKQIRGLLELIDHKIEEEKLIKKPDLYDRLKKDLKHQQNIDKFYREPLRKRAGSMFTHFPKYKEKNKS